MGNVEGILLYLHHQEDKEVFISCHLVVIWKNLNAVACNGVCQVPKYVCPYNTDAENITPGIREMKIIIFLGVEVWRPL